MARSAADAVRGALDEFFAGEQRARLVRLRDPGDDVPPETRRRGRWLVASPGADALAEALESGQLGAEEARALAEHVARLPYTLDTLVQNARLRAALAQARLPSGDALQLTERLARIARADDARVRAAAARELDRALDPIALAHVAAHARAEEPLLVERAAAAEEQPRPAPAARSSGLLIVSAYSPEALAPKARDLPDADWLAHAKNFLSRTEAAAEQALERAARGLHWNGKRLPWDVLLRALRAPDLDSDSGAKLRFQRASAWLRGLGFERDMSARMRGEPDRGGALPLAHVLPLAIPRDVRVAQFGTDCGVASDVFAADGVARGLGFALTHAALPAELRWPLGATTPGALGGLALQLWGELGHLQRVQHMPRLAAERVGRLASTLALLHARLFAALAVAELPDGERPGARREALAEALGAALLCDLPEGIAGLIGADRVAARARALEALTGLALHAGLRERFDEDWFRNPRSAELLRDVCAPGNRLGPERLCELLGISLESAAARACELVA
jgi:hypothetical protein